jgi:hypothetical protein
VASLNVNIPKTIGNTSTIRGGKVGKMSSLSVKKRINRHASNNSNSDNESPEYRQRQFSDDSRKTGTTFE